MKTMVSLLDPDVGKNRDSVYEGAEAEGQIVPNEPGNGLMATNAINVNVDDILQNLEANDNGDVNVAVQNEDVNSSQKEDKQKDNFNQHLKEQAFIENDVVMEDIVNDMETIR